ncbi:MAG: hypothetical protein ABI693_15910 [Bryobacteraceae bacterium]
MNRPEAEKLLGGYATGTLTEAEKAELFSAALDHQELFDALADEEMLREILADPGARQRLLAALPEPQRVSWWGWLRRPAALGLAASLAGALVVGVALWMYSSRADRPVVEMADVRTAPVPAPPENRPQAKAVVQAPPKVSKRQEAKPIAPREEKVELAQPDQLALRARSEASAENRLTDQSAEVKQKAREVRGVIGGVVGGVPAFTPAAPPTALYRIAKEAARAVPIANLERMDSGQARLTVTSPAGGVLYVAARKGSTVDLLTAQQSIAGPSGTTEARYEFPLAGVDAVDLYVLPVAISNPLTLPANGSGGGYYRRVYPDEKTLPKP